MCVKLGLLLLISSLIPNVLDAKERCSVTWTWNEMECVDDQIFKYGTVPELIKSIRYLSFKNCSPSLENNNSKTSPTFRIDCNQTTVEEGPLTALTKLRHILFKADVSHFQQHFFCPFELNNLILSNNGLSSEEDFGLLTNCSAHQEDDTCGNSLFILDITYTKLKSITKNGFLCNLRYLFSLNLTGNEISSIEVGSFGALQKLEHLYLGNNQLSTIPTGLFSSFGYLKWLDLSGNQISALEPNAFQQNSFLSNLDLSKNGLNCSIESSTFAGLDSLSKLNLAGNSLSHISADAFSACPRLEFLYLNHNRLKRMPELLAHPRLVWLYLDHNEIEEVSESGISDTIAVLGLSYNKLGLILRKNIFQNFYNLYNLDLSGNGIEELSDGTFDFNLTKLYEKYSWKSGSVITLSGRNVIFQDKIYNKSDPWSQTTEFRKVINMVNLTHNRIKKFKYSWLPKDSNAVLLDHNRIGQLPKFDSHEISELLQISVSGNLIESVLRDQLPPGLTRLYMDSNRIGHVEAGTFENLKKLEVLYLQNNSLTTVRGLQLNNSTTLIKIQDNPFTCNCETAEEHKNYVLNYQKIIDSPNELLCKTDAEVAMPIVNIDLTRCIKGNVKQKLLTWWQLFTYLLVELW